MKRIPSPTTDDALDRLIDQQLAGNSEQLAPSSGFALSVMEAIETQVAEPPPIAFPWRRALPGLAALLCCLSVLAIMLLQARTGATLAGYQPQSGAQYMDLLKHRFSARDMALSWIAVAAFLSIAAVAASFRFAGRRG